LRPLKSYYPAKAIGNKGWPARGKSRPFPDKANLSINTDCSAEGERREGRFDLDIIILFSIMTKCPKVDNILNER
jgi:hypothetical protein